MDSLATLLDRQKTRLLQLHFPHNDGPKAELLINRFNGTERLSGDFEFTLELISDSARIELKDVMGKMVTVELERAQGEPRYFNGYAFDFRLLHSDGGYSFYGLTLRPWLAFLSRRTDNYLFHDKTTQQALKLIFSDYGESAVEFRVAAGKTHTFQAQWEESDYNYVHRRMEDAGWYYWYEHTANAHTLVISNDSLSAPAIDQDPVVRFHNDSSVLDHDAITAWTPQRKLVSGKVTLSSFDFKQPKPMKADVDTRNAQGKVADYEVYEYAGAFGFTDPGQGRALALRQMEEIERSGKTFTLAGNARLLQAGRTFDLRGHFEHDKGDPKDARFLLIEVAHHATNNYLQDAGDEQVYRNQATVIRKHIPFRPGRGYNSASPKLYGLQSAIVVGPAGEEIYCDKYGRVRVQFHWDREGKYDEKSSCWVRVATTWAGSNFGAMSIPRIDQEVLVQFLDGNPDLPIITGRVYNETHMPPWDLPANKTQTGILTRSSKGGGYDNANALRFEDKKGEEQLWLHAEKDQLTEVEHDEDKWVGNDRRKTIDHDETNHIKHDRTETVDHDETITVHGKRTEVVDGNEDITIHSSRTERVDHNETISIGDNRTEDVGQNETLSVGANRTRNVGANESVSVGSSQSVSVGSSKTETVAIAKALTVGAGYAITVGGAMNTAVGLMQTEQVGLTKSINVGDEYTLTVGKKLTIEVGKTIIVMNADGSIAITGKTINLTSQGGDTTINGEKVWINPVGGKAAAQPSASSNGASGGSSGSVPAGATPGWNPNA